MHKVVSCAQMSGNEKLVVTKQYLDAEQVWDQKLSVGENLSVLFPPVSDAQRRMVQFTTEHADKYTFLQVDPLNFAIEELAELENSLLSEAKFYTEFKDQTSFDSLVGLHKKMGKKLVITCSLADFLLTSKGRHFLPLFQKIIFRYTPTVTCMLPFETDITHPNHTALIRSYHMLFQHIVYYPIYSSSDALVFVNYLYKKWGLKIKNKEIKDIIEKCGGYFWLLKEAARQIRDNGSWSINSDNFQYRLQTIAQSLNESEYSTLTRILTKSRGLDDVQLHSKDYLFKIGILDSKNNLTTPLLKEEIVRLGASKRKLILIKNNIYLNQVPVSKYFSRKEFRIIKLLLSREGQIVSRDEIADKIWPLEVEEKYSEWAIDQLIRRLRHRLTELLIPKTVLRSVRGKGYIYVQS